jgi:hypothetical protein
MGHKEFGNLLIRHCTTAVNTTAEVKGSKDTNYVTALFKV